MSTLLVVNSAPCGSEGPCDALRPATAPATIHDLAGPVRSSDRQLSS